MDEVGGGVWGDEAWLVLGVDWDGEGVGVGGCQLESVTQ